MDKPVFSPEYFQDEVRCGFYISEMMKRFWAAQLIVLYEIVKICERHSIKWYADMGTLLGAVRHKGYVPWDDDLDISMNRPDWERFFEVAKDELPEGYYALSIRSNEEYNLSLGRVCNSHGIHTDREHMERFCGCPYCVGIDVYPIDRLYKDPAKEQERKDRGKAISRVFKLIESEGIKSNNTRKLLAEIERSNHTILHRNGNLSRELMLLFEKICLECKDEDYDEVALNHTWILWDWANCPRRDYEDQIDIPFENIILKAPKYYDELLTIYYHDYMQIFKGGGAHEYPIYQDQEQILREHLGHNPYRYTFSNDDLSFTRKEKPFQESCSEILNLMKDSINQIGTIVRSGSDNDIAVTTQILGGCQNIAITLGTMIEGKYGEGLKVIKQLEDYCELLYVASSSWNEETDKELATALDSICTGVEELFDNTRRKIVFLPCRYKWWNAMKPVYDSICADSGMDVKVMPIPYFDKDPYGSVGDEHDESDSFTDIEGFIPYAEYDIEIKHPDIIVIQVPFDEWSCAMCVPEKYYSRNLLKCCDELWYVPCFDAEPPINTDDKASSALAVLVEQPSVFNSDRIILFCEEMKDYYRLKLAEITGAEKDSYWDDKIWVF